MLLLFLSMRAASTIFTTVTGAASYHQPSIEKAIFGQDISRQFDFNKDVLEGELGDLADWEFHSKAISELTCTDVKASNRAKMSIVYRLSIETHDGKIVEQYFGTSFLHVILSKIRPEGQVDQDNFSYFKDYYPAGYQMEDGSIMYRNNRYNERILKILGQTNIDAPRLSVDEINFLKEQLAKINIEVGKIRRTILFADIDADTNNKRLRLSNDNFKQAIEERGITQDDYNKLKNLLTKNKMSLVDLEDLIFNFFPEDENLRSKIPVWAQKRYKVRFSEPIRQLSFEVYPENTINPSFLIGLSDEMKNGMRWTVDGKANEWKYVPSPFSDSEQSILGILMSPRGRSTLIKGLKLPSIGNNIKSITIKDCVLNIASYYAMCIRCRTIYFLEQDRIRDYLFQVVQEAFPGITVNRGADAKILISSSRNIHDIIRAGGDGFFVIQTYKGEPNDEKNKQQFTLINKKIAER